MCSVVGHMMGMELDEFLSATNGRGVLSMVIACVGRTMDKELMFPSATIGRGVHSMVIACVPRSKYETWMFYYRRGVCRAGL